MLRSINGNLTIEAVKDKSNIIIPASDVSVINTPVDDKNFEKIVKNISSVPTDKHICVMTARHTKAELLKSLSNLHKVKDLEFLDIAYLSYQKSGRRTGSFTHLAEPAYIFYKGLPPSVENTSWFRGSNSPNASNHWDFSPYDGGDIKENTDHSVYPKFSWDFGLILMTLAHPVNYKKIVWTLPWDENLISFVVNFDVKLHLITTTDSEAIEAMKCYELLKSKKDSKEKT